MRDHRDGALDTPIMVDAKRRWCYRRSRPNTPVPGRIRALIVEMACANPAWGVLLH
jgi:hypothetical protein